MFAPASQLVLSLTTGRMSVTTTQLQQALAEIAMFIHITDASTTRANRFTAYTLLVQPLLLSIGTFLLIDATFINVI